VSEFKQIQAALHRVFHEENQRIVFWNDPDREFLDALPSITIDAVTPVRLDQVGALEVKIRLERKEPQAKFLLYSPAEEPDYEDDWLLDIRLYSRSFRADRASILLQDLGLANQHLRTHIADRRKFFDAKDRFQKIKGLVAPDDTAADIDRKMIAVVTKADQPELFNILRTVFHAWAEAGADIDLDDTPAAWTNIEKFDLDIPFWQMVRAAFGYADENPSLKKLLFALFVTDYAHQLNGEIPQAVRGFVLPRAGASNVVVCLAQWRDSTSKGTSYDKLSALAAAILKIEDHLPYLEIDQLAGVMTFLAVEKRIASSLRERVQTTADDHVVQIEGVYLGPLGSRLRRHRTRRMAQASDALGVVQARVQHRQCRTCDLELAALAAFHAPVVAAGRLLEVRRRLADRTKSHLSPTIPALSVWRSPISTGTRFAESAAL
jgi:uncharacterized protein (TIGR02687 family)